MAPAPQIKDGIKIEELVKMLQAERIIELNHLQGREQWFCVPYIGCLAGTVAGLASTHPVIFVGLPVLFGGLTVYLCRSRRKGLYISLRALEERHNTTSAICR